MSRHRARLATNPIIHATSLLVQIYWYKHPRLIQRANRRCFWWLNRTEP
ncbi:hypothetical protein CHUV0807_1260 [Cardiobacterium hominis]|uniref:Uncharacterized protein n=1 Tax=Cardiobacterium hominis TaxID=2718 RepID=A0A1C3H4P9_9GAMM|nr:hypothetical protein CHUV0807_1260 [Cardiobacterium hominis]